MVIIHSVNDYQGLIQARTKSPTWHRSPLSGIVASSFRNSCSGLSRLFSYNPSVFPHVYRRAMKAGSLARTTRRKAETSADAVGKTLCLSWWIPLLHGQRSISVAVMFLNCRISPIRPPADDKCAGNCPSREHIVEARRLEGRCGRPASRELQFFEVQASVISAAGMQFR